MLRLQNDVRNMIASGEPLVATLERLCIEAEKLLDAASCVIVGVNSAGLIHPLASPSFPDLYSKALEGILIGPETGSCGSAIYRNVPVFVEDIEHDPKWAAFKSLALPLGWKACTSTPVRNEEGRPIGAVGLYFREVRGPSDDERAVLSACVELCELAMRRHGPVMEQDSRRTIDSLSGLPNRLAFDNALSGLRCELPGSWALLVIDIDNLKSTNEMFGRDVGNALIRAVGQRIAMALAPDMTFRTGGDEFTVIVQDRNSLHDLSGTANLIHRAISAPVHCAGHNVIPRASIGGAVLAPQDARPEAVRRNAHFALYHAKTTLSGGFFRYQPHITTRVTQRQDSVREVTEALRDNRIDAQYQPVICLETNEIVGFEALSRMTSAAGDILPASLFQEALADAHIVAELTLRMLEIAAKDMRTWLDEGLPFQHVSVNVTSADFYTGDLSAKIDEAFARSGVPLNCLSIEVTENVYFGQRDRVVATGIADLRMKGVHVALDDFGTGFAALTHLLSVPIDMIKIDQSFIRGLEPGDSGTAIVRGLLQIAQDLGISAVAEGIETAQQAERLHAMGCTLGQGYAFSSAVQRKKAAQLLRRHAHGLAGAGPLSPASGSFER